MSFFDTLKSQTGEVLNVVNNALSLDASQERRSPTQARKETSPSQVSPIQLVYDAFDIASKAGSAYDSEFEDQSKNVDFALGIVKGFNDLVQFHSPPPVAKHVERKAGHMRRKQKRQVVSRKHKPRVGQRSDAVEVSGPLIVNGGASPNMDEYADMVRRVVEMERQAPSPSSLSSKPASLNSYRTPSRASVQSNQSPFFEASTQLAGRADVFPDPYADEARFGVDPRVPAFHELLMRNALIKSEVRVIKDQMKDTYENPTQTRSLRGNMHYHGSHVAPLLGYIREPGDAFGLNEAMVGYDISDISV